jgi:ApbE superfamily uncharacterized protein (UPF0280 family)
VKLLKKKARSFEIQVQDMVLHISAAADLNEESRAAALSFWEQLHSYTLRNPAIRTSKRPIEVPEDAPAIVREMVVASSKAGVGPMYSFRGAVIDHVGRHLARDMDEVTVSCGGGLFVLARKRRKITVHSQSGDGVIAVVVEPRKGGVGAATASEREIPQLDALAVLAESCMLADAAAAGVRAIVAKPDGFRLSLSYLRKVPGVLGGVIVQGQRIGVAGGVEIAS